MKNLLLLEDDDLFREQLAKALGKRHYTVASSATLAQACDHLARLPQLDAAVLDMNLGDENGIDLIDRIIPLFPACRIIILTGYGSISSAVQAIHKGAWNYLPKPASVDDIINAIENSPTDGELRFTDAAPSLDRLEWEHIQRVLDDNDGNISAAARVLGIHRRTLQRRLKKRPAAKDYLRDK